MPYTRKQIAMLHEDAAGKGIKGPGPAAAKKMLAEQHGQKARPAVRSAVRAATRPATRAHGGKMPGKLRSGDLIRRAITNQRG